MSLVLKEQPLVQLVEAGILEGTWARLVYTQLGSTLEAHVPCVSDVSCGF